MNPLPAAPADTTHDTGGIGGHPRGLTTLFFTEMWERFSYYGMRAILMLFMVKTAAEGGLGFDTKKAAAIYGTYTMSVYLLSILGGFIADNFIGARRAMVAGGIIIATGHFTMATGSIPAFYTGLVLIAIGTGLLKPNISTMVGSLYSEEDGRRDAGFSIFYMGINIGAFLSPLVTGYLAQSEGWRAQLASWGLNPVQSWHWGFGAAGVGMTLGLLVYVRQRERLAHVGNAPAPEPGSHGRPWGKLGLVALGSVALIGAMKLSDTYPAVILVLFALQIGAILFFGFRPDPDSKRMAAILVFFFAAQIFWAIFEQTGSSITLFADNLTDNTAFGQPFPSSWWQSVNSAWVILLAPLFAWLWIKLGPRQPSSPMKFTLGLLFVALSFVLMVPAAKLTAEGKVSPLWLVGLYFLQTTGEMLLSPVGLSTMTRLAPQRLVGLVMGIWFLASALGSKLAGVIAGEFKSDNPAELASFFWQQALWVGAATVALFALVPWVKRLMGGVR
ncbi:MAG: peptide MFS transporter [Opitutaceae bacterium]|nr:peptide MFS transporter [Opitutaceae bacterium]